jgi:hypothetical protein
MHTHENAHRRPLLRTAICLVLSALVAPQAVDAQGGQFGGQSRADSAREMIVLAVQQGISSLPPTSGQSFNYEYDAATDTFVRSSTLGPTSFHATRTIAKGSIAFRLAASYFEMEDDFGPNLYLVEFDEPIPSGPGAGLQPAGVAGFGLEAEAQVGLLNWSVSYGLTRTIELTLNVPVTIVDAQARQSFSTTRRNANLPPSEAVASGAFQLNPLSSDPAIRASEIAALRSAFDASLGCANPDCLVFRSAPVSDFGFDFDDSTSVGVGRISAGARRVMYSGKHLRVALMSELFFPSPSEDELAGPDSWAVLPRAIFATPLPRGLWAHVDVGYDHDFSESSLRRLVWKSGASLPLERFNFDFGIGGSEYDTPIEWTPGTAKGERSAQFAPTTLTSLDDTRLGDTFVDFIGGLKVQVLESAVVSGAVTVPLNGQGFRPAALGTLALEAYF